MDKIELIKNKLDKEYEFESKKAMGWFTMGTITLAGFIATMLIYGQYLFAGVFGFLIFFCSIFLFQRRQKKLMKILSRIEGLGDTELRQK